MGRRRQQRALEAALANALSVGIQAGRRRALEDALELTARKLFADEAELVIALLDEADPETVLDVLPRLRDEVMAPRWYETMRPLLADILASEAQVIR